MERARTVEVEGRRFQVRILEPEQPWRELARRRRDECAPWSGRDGRDRLADAGHRPLGRVADGDEVEAGQVICIVEAMKMENEVRAPHAGTVGELSVAAGQPVATGQVICVLR